MTEQSPLADFVLTLFQKKTFVHTCRLIKKVAAQSPAHVEITILIW